MTFQTKLRCFIGLASLLAASSFVAMAQRAPVRDGSEPAAAAIASQPPSWSVGCAATERAAALTCAVEQRAFVGNTGQLIGSVSVRVAGDAGEPVMTITTPLGLFLPAGISIAIDEDASQRLEVQTCDAQGCYAESPVSENLLSRMFQGNILNVGFQDRAKRQITLPLPLAGFTAAYAKIK